MSYAKKPRIRKMFIPDPGYVMFEADLKQADLQIVACEAKDNILLDIFNTPGSDVHAENFKIAFPGQVMTDQLRQDSKQLVHGTNYVGGIPKMARTLDMSREAVASFQVRWFKEHPGIKKWHEEIGIELQTTRGVRNCFGYFRPFLGYLDSCFPEAVAWKPQSTVALIINYGIENIENNLGDRVQLIMQVHDSVLGQVTEQDFSNGILHQIRKEMLIPLPYARPHTIDVTLKYSRKNWQEMEKFK